MRKRISIIITVLLTVGIVTSCNKIENDISVIPSQTPRGTESIETIEPTAEPYFNIDEIKFSNSYSENMNNIISLAKNYLEKDNFLNPNSYYAVYNKMFIDYDDKNYLTYNEFKKFLQIAETSSPHWEELTAE